MESSSNMATTNQVFMAQQPGSTCTLVKPETEDNDEVASKFCCLRGCLSTSIIAFLFFVMLPSGILLILYSDRNDNSKVLPIGIVLICLPFIVMPIIVYVLLRRKQVSSCMERIKWWT